MRLPNIKILLSWPSRMHIYGFVENRTFLEQFVSMGVLVHFSIKWSSLIAWGYQHNLHFYGSVGFLECIFMAPFALFNEGVPAHFFHLIEVPTMGSQTKTSCSIGPLECIFMASLKIAHFWSNLLAWGHETIFIYGGNHNEAPHRNVLERMGSKQLSEAKERKGRMVTLLRVHEIGWYLKGCPNLGPPLPHPFSMVQSDVKRFEIYYKLFE